jgi:integrase
MFLSQRGGIYYVWFIDEQSGKRQKISTGCTLKSDALKFLTEFRSNCAQKKLTHTLLSSYIPRYLEFSRVNHSVNSTKRIEYVLLPFKEFISNRYLQNIKPFDIDAYKASRLKQVSAITVNIELRTLKAFFNQAVKWDILATSPFKNIKLLKIAERNPVFLTKEDFTVLLRNIAKGWLRSVVIFAVNTGMRRSEIVNLQWQDIELKRNTILVANSESFKTKSGRQRIVPINSLAKRILATQKRISPYVFVNSKGEKLKGNYLSQCFHQSAQDANLDDKLNFHSLRHTFASWLVQSGVGIYEVQKLLGHSSIAVTQVYAYLSENELHGAVGRIKLNLN